MYSKHQHMDSSTGGPCSVLCMFSICAALAMGAKSVTVIEVNRAVELLLGSISLVTCYLVWFPLPLLPFIHFALLVSQFIL